MALKPQPSVAATPAEADRAARRRRSVALAIVLGAAVLVFYILTIVKMGPGAFDRPL